MNLVSQNSVWRKLRVALLLAASAMVSCSATPAKEFDFKHGSPLDLLTYLEEQRSSRSAFTIETPVANWVREEHLPALVKLLDSEVECMPVVLAVSSELPKNSTVGSEATLMVQGFRDGTYPPAPFAGSLDAAKKEEIKLWWNERKR